MYPTSPRSRFLGRSLLLIYLSAVVLMGGAVAMFHHLPTPLGNSIQRSAGAQPYSSPLPSHNSEQLPVSPSFSLSGNPEPLPVTPSPTPLRFDLIPKRFQGPDGRYQPRREKGPITIPAVDRDRLIAFCLYTTHRGVLKINVQLYPVPVGESRQVTLWLDRGRGWEQVAEQAVDGLGWSTVFRVEKWDDTKSARYRITHPAGAQFEGLIRANPRDKDEIVVACLSCNAGTDRNPRPDLVTNLLAIDPDLLFFAGDQSYDHKNHLAAWLLFGRQFGEVIKDRPTVTIPDDHDVGHPNLWGAGGKQAFRPDGADGGYFMPVEYVNMVQRQQCGHLPDPFDPTPIARGITVYYTRLNVGGIDFAILEDRKWKSGPYGLVKIRGPRPDHVVDPQFDPRTVDVPEATLLGERQLQFLRQWAADWQDAVMKCVLSQTTFAGAAHLHGPKQERLTADLDCNGWPQSGRNAALCEIRKGFAFMIAGDQHLATLIHHGVNDWRDSGWQFTCPSIWNLYGRAWHPLEKSPRPWPNSPLPFTGDYHDGLGNKITITAYANPSPENYEGTGFGVVRFRKSTRTIVVECWPRFVDVTKPGATQYPGWPQTISQFDNYGRQAVGYLPPIQTDRDDPVVQLVDETDNSIVYTVRIHGRRWQPKTFRIGPHTLRLRWDDGTVRELRHLSPNFDPPITSLPISSGKDKPG
jgi:hypothetical protein